MGVVIVQKERFMAGEKVGQCNDSVANSFSSLLLDHGWKGGIRLCLST